MNNEKAEEKTLKEKILMEALSAFAEHGYRGASTNSLAEAAGVSKGLIFHHYGSKKTLYLACARHAFEVFEQEMRQAAVSYSSELVDRMIDQLRFKMESYFKNPVLSKFLIRFYLDALADSFPEAEELFKEFSARLQTILFENVDTEGYREGYDSARLREYVVTVVEAYGNRFLAQYKNNYMEAADHIEELVETVKYVKMLIKSGIYTAGTGSPKQDPF